MSNNKQSMKLYTEEQLIDAINKSFLIEYPSTGNDILNQLTPIKLPNHYEIWDEAHKEESNERHYAFIRGAKWMRDKIQGGNNEQE